MECGVGTYMESKDGKMRCDECGHVMISEAWDTEMHTAEKDKGMFKGKTIADLEKMRGALMKKATRSTAEQKKVKQIDFAIRAKKKFKGKVKETVEVTEKAPPGKKAEDFIMANKAAFKKRYGKNWERALYATAWKQFGETITYDGAREKIHECRQNIERLQQDFESHKHNFARLVTEGTSSDPLKLGYGLEGEAILQRIARFNKKISEAKSIMQHQLQEGVLGMIKEISALNRASEVAQIKTATPYGVIYTTPSGRKSKKMFESMETRNYWLELKGHSIGDVKMIEPETFDKVIAKKSR
jgi:hypothetical protein